LELHLEARVAQRIRAAEETILAGTEHRDIAPGLSAQPFQTLRTQPASQHFRGEDGLAPFLPSGHVRQLA